LKTSGPSGSLCEKGFVNEEIGSFNPGAAGVFELGLFREGDSKMKMLVHSLVIFVLIAGTAAIGHQHALAQLVSPFGRNMEGKPLKPEELELMKKAIRDALEQYKVGAESVWESGDSQRAGRAEVIELFERDGMRCAKLTHEFTKGAGKAYTAPMCKVDDGTWKLAF
jgi:surface antigen